MTRSAFSPPCDGTSLVAIQKTAIASTNFSTLGTLDWLFLPTAASNPNQGAINSVHNKTSGGFLYSTWSWQSVGATAFTQAGGQTWSCNADDTQLGAALNTTTVAGFFTASGVLTGFGARFLAPAAKKTQICRVYVQAFSCVVQLDAYLRNSTKPATSAQHDTGAAASLSTVFEIAYRANQPTDLNVVVWVQANHGSSPHIKIAGASVGRV